MTEPSFDVFDIHQHVGALDMGNSGAAGLDLEDDYRRRVESMDRFGVKSGAIMPALQYLRPNGQADTRKINDLVAGYRDRYQARFPVAIGTVEPLHGPELGTEEIERIAKELGMKGVVWHHRMQGTTIADRRMRPFLTKLSELRLPAFIHVFAESNLEAPWGLEELASEYSDVTFVALDAFSGHTQSRYLLAIGKRCPNIVFETACVFVMGRIIEEFAAELGSQRIIFGTDLYVNPPMYHYPHVLNEVIHAPRLSEDDKRNILWRNSQRLLGLA